ATAAKGQAVASPAELAKAVAGRQRSRTCGEGGSKKRRQRFRASNGPCLTFVVEAGGELAAITGEGHSGHPFLLPLFLRMSSTPLGVSCRPHRLLPPPLRSGRLASPTARPPPPVFSGRNHWQLVVTCKKEDNDMSFLMLLDSLHMGEHTSIQNELKSFLKIAYDGKWMRAVGNEMKVIDVHMSTKHSETNKQNKSKHTFFHCAGSKSFADIYHEEFLKTGATLDRGDLFIRTRMKKAGSPVNDESAAMIDKIRDIKLTQQSSTSSSIVSVGDAYEQVMGRDRTGSIRGIGTGPTPKSLCGSRSTQKLRQDNDSLKEKIEAVEERMKKFESRGNNESSASVCHAQKKKVVEFLFSECIVCSCFFKVFYKLTGITKVPNPYIL
ncbi:hypothetical protein Taro_002454, partial [Colocasia esculenta]|nr:hypothetical protein [Colocasia esculenta]